MPASPLVPARLKLSDGGVPFSEAFDDVYHSSAGALCQARHVFLGGNGLPARWRQRGRFVVLETGFGLGLNFLTTWQTWRDDPRDARQLHYLAVEKHPFSTSDMTTLHKAWPELAPLSAELLSQWPPLVPGFHRLHLDEGRVVLTLLFGDVAECLPRLNARADAIYLDGFAPAKNPQMWSPQVFKALARLCHGETTLATYSVASTVQDGLAAAGFAVEKRPGFAPKRWMLGGHYRTRTGQARIQANNQAPAGRAIVIGGGLAGAACAHRLACRGWEIELIERHDLPAQEASGNHAGILMPMLSRDDNFASRIARAGFLYALRQLRQLTVKGFDVSWSPCGVLQLARDPRHAEQQRAIIEELGYPADFATYVSLDEASRRAGVPVAAGGWLFPEGAWVRPPSVCRALLEHAGRLVQAKFCSEAVNLEHDEEAWSVRDHRGKVLARAPVLILANGTDTASFAQASGLQMQRIRGQVSLLPSSALPSLSMAICREGYVTPPVESLACAGATYDLDDDRNLRLDSHRENLARLERLLPGVAAGLDPSSLGGRVGFRAVPPDRLPLVGALPQEEMAGNLCDAQLTEIPRWPGLYCLTGLGSRGMAWGMLAAELLASQLNGEPLPMETELVGAVDPARFLLRRHRCGKTQRR